MIPPDVKSRIPKNVLEELSSLKMVEDLALKIKELETAKEALSLKIESGKNSRMQMTSGLKALTSAKAEVYDTLDKMVALKAAIPGTFDVAKANYLAQIDALKEPLEGVYQKTLNEGFKQVYLTVTIASIIALLILLMYKRRTKDPLDQRV